MEEIYGHPVSQPARAVVWLCKLQNHAIDYKFVNIPKGETRTDAFRQLNPAGKVPVLKDGEFVLTESHAIMIYIATKHGWTQWYPSDRCIQARIHEYMNWHHLNARRCSQIFLHTVLVKVGRGTPEMEKTIKKQDQIIQETLGMLEYWLSHPDGSLYLVSGDHQPTLVDLSCYSELVQLEAMGLLARHYQQFHRVAAWMKHMKTLPHHDEMLAPMVKFLRKFDLLAPSSCLSKL